jgi:predicted nucleotidyltransferase
MVDCKTYRKVYSIDERYKILRERYPQFLIYDDVFNEYLPEIDHSSIIRSYLPERKSNTLRKKTRLDHIERQAALFLDILKREAKIPWSSIGITGSLLVGLYTDKSDIDAIVYGTKNCLRVRNAMQDLLSSQQHISAYGMEDLKKLYEFRVKDTMMPFEDFVRHETRKSFQGLFDGRDFFIRYVKDWDEVKEKYGEVIYKSEGYAKIRAKIIDDSESMFTPCVYKVAEVEFMEGQRLQGLKEIASFRGRFCEQVKNDEVIIAQGKVERVITRDENYRRILLGSGVMDFMISINHHLDKRSE